MSSLSPPAARWSDVLNYHMHGNMEPDRGSGGSGSPCHSKLTAVAVDITLIHSFIHLCGDCHKQHHTTVQARDANY